MKLIYIVRTIVVLAVLMVYGIIMRVLTNIINHPTIPYEALVAVMLGVSLTLLLIYWACVEFKEWRQKSNVNTAPPEPIQHVRSIALRNLGNG